MEKFAFARLVNWIGKRGIELDNYEVKELYNLVTPTEQPKINAEEVNELLRAMKANEFILVIKAYRTLTGLGLKESKDAIEKYREVKVKSAAELKQEMIDSFDRYGSEGYNIKQFIQRFKFD